MGTSLYNVTPSSSFDSLIKLGDNDRTTTALKQLSDGMGTDLPIYLSTTSVVVTGSLYGSSSYAATSSYVKNSISASYSTTASYVQNAQTASFIQLAQTASYLILRNLPEYPDNGSAVAGGLPVGAVYRASGQDFLMVVH